MKRATVLFVDDDKDLAREVLRLLKREGFAAEWAANGDDGLEKALLMRPSVICVDLTLPRMSGFDFCERVRGDVILAATPLVIVSARHTPLVRAQALDCGADGYVRKPFDRRELLGEIARAMGVRTMMVAHAEEAPEEAILHPPGKIVAGP